MADSVETSVAAVSPYLKQVRIRDYPPLRDAKVDFKPGLNVIIGKNGSGKTRFLTLISALADLSSDQEHFWGAGCKLVIGGMFGGQDEVAIEFKEQAADTLGIEPLELLVHLPGSAAPRKMDQFSTLLMTAGHQAIGGYSVVLVRHGIPVAGLPIMQESAELLLEKRNFTVQLKNGSKRLNEISSRFCQAMLRTIVQIIRNGFSVINGGPVPPMTAEAARQQILRAVEVYLLHINYHLPLYSPIQAVRCSEAFQVYYSELQDQYTVKGLVLEYLIGDAWLSFGMLSDGTKRLFYLLAEIFSPLAVSLNKVTDELLATNGEKIILLEEPELGVHPHQLHLVLTLIREVAREHQVLVTTHAPQTLDMLSKNELDRITICELDPKKGTQFRKLSAKRKAKAKAYMQHDSYLSDFWRFSNLEDPE